MFINAEVVIGAASLLLAIFTVLVHITIKITKIEAQVLPNSGSSILDKVTNIDRRLAVLEVKLER